MLIYFSGHSFKYEIEAVAKLFFPVVRFSLVFNDDIVTSAIPSSDDLIFTRLKVLSNSTLLWIFVRVNNVTFKKSITISNDKLDKSYNDECERNLCILLYKLLQQITNITPKWGVLTGVRPVSLIQKYIRLGWDKEEIYNYFQSKFLVSIEKLDLAFATANIQIDVLNANTPNSYSLYVAIPFCVSKCSYCSFVSHAIKPNDPKVDEYVSLLLLELEKTASVLVDLNLSLSSIYIGGGTPTALSANQLKIVVDAIAKFFPIEQALEYTIEAGRVDTITREKLIVIKNAWGQVLDDVNTNVRISINPQTFNDTVLQKIGRNHNATQVIDCYNLAVSLGFIHINMDFIAGLPLDSLDSFISTMDTAIALSPSNITVHTLSIKRSSALYDSVTPDSEVFTTQFMNDYAQDILTKNGYMPYYLYRQKNTLGNLENVGYAKSKQNVSIYNIYIMEEIHTIIACGAGAVTKIIAKTSNISKGVNTTKPINTINRIFNFKYHFEYINRFDEIIKRKEEVTFFYD